MHGWTSIGIELHAIKTFKTRTERRNKTELNRHGLDFDELTNGQAASKQGDRARLSLVDA